MKFSKFFQYAYLIFALLFLYDAYADYNADGVIPYAKLLLGVLAIFMFFFKRKFGKKFDDRNNSK